MTDNNKPGNIGAANGGEEQKPAEVTRKLKGTIELYHPEDDTAVIMDMQLFDSGDIQFHYGRMTPQEYQAAVGIGSFIINSVGPVTEAVRSCTNQGPFDVDRIVIAHAKRVCEQVAEQAKLGYRYTVA